MKPLLLATVLLICVLGAVGWSKETGLFPSDRFDDSSDDESENRCPCHHHHHYHHHKMPPFLKHVSADARWDYYAIISNMFTSMNDKIKQVNEWAKKQGSEVEKGVDEYFKKIENYWKDVNKNMTMTLEELPKVYPKVYKIMSDLDLKPRDIYKQIRDMKLSKRTAHSLYSLAMVVIHTDGGEYPYLMDTDMFLERVATPKIRNLFNPSRGKN